MRFSNTALQFQCGTDGNTCVYRGFHPFSVTDASAGGCAHACVRVRNYSSVPPIPRPLPPTPLAHPAGGCLRAPGIAPSRPIVVQAGSPLAIARYVPPCLLNVRRGAGRLSAITSPKLRPDPLIGGGAILGDVTATSPPANSWWRIAYGVAGNSLAPLARLPTGSKQRPRSSHRSGQGFRPSRLLNVHRIAGRHSVSPSPS